jgi:hypothetical protein
MAELNISFKSFLFLFLMLVSRGLAAQSHEHSEPHHEHPKNEIGLANHLVYLVNDQEFAYGLHIHYLRAFKSSKFGAGLGYEQIFADHSHLTLGVIGSYRPTDHLYLQLSPGIAFIGTEDPMVRFALHLETTYEFEFNHIHLGPALGFAYNSEDYHVSLGLHLAYGF